MNKEQFILELINLFDDFTEKNTPARVKAYDFILKDDFNYDELFKKTLENYQTFKYAPTPAQLLEIKNKKKTFNMNRDFFGIED